MNNQKEILVKLIDEIPENSENIDILLEKIKNITGKKDIDIELFYQYWEWTDTVSLAERLLNPEPEKIIVSNEMITEIVRKLCNVEYSESQTDYWIEFLKINTGIEDISDYIFYPDEMGLSIDAEYREIADKIIKDMNNE